MYAVDCILSPPGQKQYVEVLINSREKKLLFYATRISTEGLLARRK